MLRGRGGAPALSAGFRGRKIEFLLLKLKIRVGALISFSPSSATTPRQATVVGLNVLIKYWCKWHVIINLTSSKDKSDSVKELNTTGTCIEI